MARPRRPAAGKRKRKPPLATEEATPEEPSVAPVEEPVKDTAPEPPSRSKKRAKPSETDFFPEQRNLEDLWLAAFPVGTEWDLLDSVYKLRWSFSNLEDAFEEGGVLHGKKVYLFGCTEPQMLFFEGREKVIIVPAVVAVVSPFPPSNQIGVKSVQKVTQDILPMKEMKMDWVPYFPLENRLSRVDRLKSQIFTLSCTQRRAALKHLHKDRINQYVYSLPYFYNPLKVDEDESDTVVHIMYPTEPPVVCEFDWEMDKLSDFVDEMIQEEVLPEGEREGFKEFIKEKVRAAKKVINEAKEAREKAVEEMDEEKKQAYKDMKFYKFYPVASSDTPDISQVKSAFINRYYGKASEVF